MKNIFKRLIEARNGQDLVEYGLLVSIVALGLVGALSGFSTVISTAWSSISSMLSN